MFLAVEGDGRDGPGRQGAAAARIESDSPAQETSICRALRYVAEELLRDEGFSEVMFVEVPLTGPISSGWPPGEADLGMNFVASNNVRVDAAEDRQGGDGTSASSTSYGRS
jgi:hypothetical protein